VTWQLLAAAGEDSWWRRISSSSSADFFNGRFVFTYFFACGSVVQILEMKIGALLARQSRNCLIFPTTFIMVSIVHIVGIVRVHIQEPKP
jgi:hypothetical protein